MFNKEEKLKELINHATSNGKVQRISLGDTTIEFKPVDNLTPLSEQVDALKKDIDLLVKKYNDLGEKYAKLANQVGVVTSKFDRERRLHEAM